MEEPEKNIVQKLGVEGGMAQLAKCRHTNAQIRVRSSGMLPTVQAVTGRSLNPLAKSGSPDSLRDPVSKTK